MDTSVILSAALIGLLESAKKIARKYLIRNNNAYAIVILEILLTFIFGLVGIVYMVGAESIYESLGQISLFEYSLFAVTCILSVFAGCMYMMTLKKTNISIITLLYTAFVTIFVVGGGIIFMDEKITMKQILGILCILFGVFLI